MLHVAYAGQCASVTARDSARDLRMLNPPSLVPTYLGKLNVQWLSFLSCLTGCDARPHGFSLFLVSFFFLFSAFCCFHAFHFSPTWGNSLPFPRECFCALRKTQASWRVGNDWDWRELTPRPIPWGKKIIPSRVHVETQQESKSILFSATSRDAISEYANPGLHFLLATS
jgi:hypothetical protein